MKKYWIAEWALWWYIGKVNKKGNERLDKEPLSDNDIMQLFTAMWRYIAKVQKTAENDFTVLSTDGKELIWFKVYK